GGLLVRTLLLRFGPQEHVLLRVLHHIATDGWSSGLLWKEISALYGAYAQNLASPLGDLPIQYADFSQWQRHGCDSRQLRGSLDYWRQALSGAVRELELPTDRPRPARVSYRGGRVSFDLPAEVTVQLRAVARNERATIFMALLAGWQVLLSRYSGQ